MKKKKMPTIMIYEVYKALPLAPLGRLYTNLLMKHPRIANYTRTGGAWRVESVSGDTMTLKNGKTSLIADRYHGTILLFESLSWKHLYLPKSGVEGKIVLAVGVGCGETAAFFFENGAKKVIGVEIMKGCAQNAKENARRNGWDLDVFGEPFNLRHLTIPHDFLQLDIDGSERLLLEYNGKLGPCRIELHPSLIEPIIGRWGLDATITPEIRDRIVEKFGLIRIKWAGTEMMYGRDS